MKCIVDHPHLIRDENGVIHNRDRQTAEILKRKRKREQEMQESLDLANDRIEMLMNKYNELLTKLKEFE